MRVSRLRLPAALIAAVVVAEAAVLLLRPRDGLIDPEPVSAGSYFTPAELDRARDFRRPQLALFGAALLIDGAVLLLLARRPPARLRGPHRRPVLAGAGAGAAIVVTLTVAGLPVAAVMRERARDVGLVTQSWAGWAGDVAKGGAISALLAAGGGALGVALMRRSPRRWWLPAAGAVVAFGAASTYAAPLVVDPLFNRFTPLPEGRARSDVLELARKAGVDVGDVYAVDASRRTTAANAYVAGLGGSKRVVLYDNLLDDFTRDEVRLVIAHELGHVKHDDVPRGLLFLALAAPAGMFAVKRLSESLSPERGSAAALPAVALAVGVVSFGITGISNQLSRAVERRADAFSLEVAGAPQAFIGFEQRIARKNVSDPDPPDWATWLLGTHPPAVERIGAAEAFAKRRGNVSAEPSIDLE